MKKVTILFFVQLIVVSGFIGCNSANVRASLLQQFHQNRSVNSTSGMSSVFEKMVKKGIFKKGMSQEKVIAILGPGQHFTGIYVPGGISIGFGNKKATASNYPDFFWLHFKAKDWDKDAKLPQVLIGW